MRVVFRFLRPIIMLPLSTLVVVLLPLASAAPRLSPRSLVYLTEFPWAVQPAADDPASEWQEAANVCLQQSCEEDKLVIETSQLDVYFFLGD